MPKTFKNQDRQKMKNILPKSRNNPNMKRWAENSKGPGKTEDQMESRGEYSQSRGRQNEDPVKVPYVFRDAESFNKLIVALVTNRFQ